MAKWVHDDVLDALLNYIKNNATKMVLCSAQPANYTEANSTYKLAEVTMASGDFTLADGDSSGRKVTVAAKNAISVSSSGTGNHAALLDVSGTKLLCVTTTPSQAVVNGGVVDIGSWKEEVGDPT